MKRHAAHFPYSRIGCYINLHSPINCITQPQNCSNSCLEVFECAMLQVHTDGFRSESNTATDIMGIEYCSIGIEYCYGYEYTAKYISRVLMNFFWSVHGGRRWRRDLALDIAVGPQRGSSRPARWPDSTCGCAAMLCQIARRCCMQVENSASHSVIRVLQ